jgi:hypothetical protein
MTMTDESAELKELKAAQEKMAARIAELERAAKPPPAPDPKNFQRYDPTANFGMPAETVREMARAVPDSMMRDIALRDGRAPTGPSAQGAIPSSQTLSNVRTGGGGSSGWRDPTPLGPSMHQRYVDAQLDAKTPRIVPSLSSDTPGCRRCKELRSPSRERRANIRSTADREDSERLRGVRA